MIVKKAFGGTEIEFEPFAGTNNMMVNATEMAKAFGKRVENFTRIDTTQNFINECLKNANRRFLGIENVDGLIVSKQKSGTWMHRILALKFAAWLDPGFELWVYQTIEEIMFGYARENDESISRTVVMQFEMKQIEKKPEKTSEDFDRYMKLRDEVMHERTIRSQSTKQRFREIYRHFKDTLRNN
jgi:hypothetical protein